MVDDLFTMLVILFGTFIIILIAEGLILMWQALWPVIRNLRSHKNET
jgi:hypothetical protein